MPVTLRINTRDIDPMLEEITKSIPSEISVLKKQPQYKFDCMDGINHPLKIEQDNYTLVTVKTVTIDTEKFAHQSNKDWHHRFEFTASELDFINTLRNDPQVNWAEENSFDGLYIHKLDDYSTLSTKFKLAVYLKTEHATFWKLKFHG